MGSGPRGSIPGRLKHPSTCGISLAGLRRTRLQVSIAVLCPDLAASSSNTARSGDPDYLRRDDVEYLAVDILIRDHLRLPRFQRRKQPSAPTPVPAQCVERGRAKHDREPQHQGARIQMPLCGIGCKKSFHYVVCLTNLRAIRQACERQPHRYSVLPRCIVSEIYPVGKPHKHTRQRPSSCPRPRRFASTQQLIACDRAPPRLRRAPPTKLLFASPGSRLSGMCTYPPPSPATHLLRSSFADAGALGSTYRDPNSWSAKAPAAEITSGFSKNLRRRDRASVFLRQ